jgi:Uma2 family endonuclease
MITAVSAPPMQLILAGEPTAIDLRALQGLWSDVQYLRLTDQTNRLIEFTDGVIEVLPMPTRKHQLISRWLLLILLPLVQARGGEILYAPLRLQIRPGKYREPDLLLLLDRADQRNQDAFWLGADLVIEIVSPDDPTRDTEAKRADYAEAGIPEYWIVNPMDETITVLRRIGAQYAEHGVFHRGETATSTLLPELIVAVSATLDAT